MQDASPHTATTTSASPLATGKQTGDGPAISAAVLDNLAARFRPSGLLLTMLDAHGRVVYHDGLAGSFHVRYVLPMLQSPAATDEGVQNRVAQFSIESPIAVWHAAPGVIVSAFPYAEKRQMLGTLVLAAKSNTFKLGEDVARACSRLGLDGIWLNQQADALPTYGEEAVQRQARLLLSMTRDQVRLGSLELELDAMSAQLSNVYEELSLIYQISSGMKVNRRTTDFFRQACLDVLEVLGVKGMGVALTETNCAIKHEPAIYGPLSLPINKLQRLVDEVTEDLIDRKGPLLVNDVPGDKRFGWLSEYAHTLIAVPLQRQDQVMGCLFALDKMEGEFDSVDSKLLNSIANESAIYLENAILYEDVHGLMMGLLHALTSAVDAKDTYTCGHSERVALLSRMLAQKLDLTDAEVERVYMAGLLHDVGKIGVPEIVLQKAGRLNPEEFEHMKKHPAIGARILRDIKQLREIIPGVLHHHERYDGKGYPKGLSGESIPLMGRIICLADCFDAMTSNRTYRKALPLEVALTEIRRCAGTQFDPKLTDAFLRIDLGEFREMLRIHREANKRMVLELQESTRAA